MAEIMQLFDFPEGELGEIVSLEDRTLVEKIGIDIGMSVIVLHKAMEYLVEIGSSQISIGKEQGRKIMVKTASL